MASGRTSARTRGFVAATVMVLASSIGSFWDRAPSPRPPILDVTKLLPPLFTKSSALGEPTQENCTTKAVSDFDFSIKVTAFSLTTTGGVDVTVPNYVATNVNFAGNDGEQTAAFFSGVTSVSGSFSGFKPTIDPALTIKAYLPCVIGGETRWYFTDGNDQVHQSEYKTGANGEAEARAAMKETTIKFGGGSGTSFTPTINANFTVTPGQATRVNMPVKNESAFALWDVSVVLGLADDTAHMVFPAQPNTSGNPDVQQF